MKFTRWNFIDLFAKIKEFVQLDPQKIISDSFTSM